jgi:hypothetical protein
MVTFTPVDFSNQANFSWVSPEPDPGGPTGVYFPNGPIGQVTLGGIPFDITSNAAGYQRGMPGQSRVVVMRKRALRYPSAFMA